MDENELFRRAQAGDAEATEIIVASYRVVVERIARKYGQADLARNRKAGELGLRRCVRKFDADSGYGFSSYATWWIRYQITRVDR